MSLTHYLAQLRTNPLGSFQHQAKTFKNCRRDRCCYFRDGILPFPTTSMTNSERRVSQIDMGEAVTQVHVHVADDNLAVATTGNVPYQAELFHKMMKLQERVEY